MPPPPLSPTIRYFPPGIRKTYWVPAMVNYNTPTRAELNSGVDLTAEINTMSGWSVTSAMIDVPDMGTRFTGQVPGALTSASNDITFYLSQNSNDVRSLLTRGTVGYIVVLWEGDVPGLKMDVFPVQVSSAANDATVTDAGKTTVSFAATKIPAVNVAIPA